MLVGMFEVDPFSLHPNYSHLMVFREFWPNTQKASIYMTIIETCFRVHIFSLSEISIRKFKNKRVVGKTKLYASIAILNKITYIVTE